MKLKVHYRDKRLFVNAGMCFPICYISSGPLDTDKGRLTTTGNEFEVTCKRCLKRLKYGKRQV